MMPNAASKLIRRTHMYLALFLTPWMVLYALSTLVMNHHGFTSDPPPSFTQERELNYTNTLPSDLNERDAARQILGDLDLDGPFNVGGSLKQGRLAISRAAPVLPRRITYLPKEQRVTVEKEKFDLSRFLRRMHTQRGFTQPYAAATMWGLTVDLVVLAMVFWVASGIWMWWEIKPARRFGGIMAVAGITLYALLLAML
jgi:hypothetical protein